MLTIDIILSTEFPFLLTLTLSLLKSLLTYIEYGKCHKNKTLTIDIILGTEFLVNFDFISTEFLVNFEFINKQSTISLS
jgi:hypothetical protein